MNSCSRENFRGGGLRASRGGRNDREEQVEDKGERMTLEHRLIRPNGKYIQGGIEGHVS